MSRPRAEVLTVFAAANVAILLGALVLRRRAPGRTRGARAAVPSTAHTA